MNLKQKNNLIFLLLVLVMALVFAACSGPKGSIIILEEPSGKQFDISYNTWKGQEKCQMSLVKGDEVKVEIYRENGEISMSIYGKNGSEPYQGNDLDTVNFIFNVSETDEYVISLSGNKATGKVLITNLSK